MKLSRELHRSELDIRCVERITPDHADYALCLLGFSLLTLLGSPDCLLLGQLLTAIGYNTSTYR
jgi:hypothetical protein